MSPEFTSRLSQSVGNALAKQLAFSDFLGDRSWSVDLTEGCVTFGHDLSYPIQLLGTIPELISRSFSLEIAKGDEISMIASGLNPTCCYYRGPYIFWSKMFCRK